MGIVTNSPDMKVRQDEFRELREKFEEISADLGPNSTWHTLSMGMSDDFEMAIQEGSNMIRLGSRIFGPRTY